MMEPWEIDKEDGRKVDSTTVFIVFCEDGAVEPAYLKAMNTKSAEISCIPNSGQHHQNVDRATDHLRDQGMLEVINGKEVLKIQDGMQVWCMFDRDRDSTKDDGKTTSFNDSIASAESRGIQVAWSNDDFELWVLLHFENVDPTNAEYQNRSQYYERLTYLLKEALSSDSEGSRIVSHPTFSYKDAMKTKNKFIRFTLQLMKGKTAVAITRAKELEVFHNLPAKTSHQKSPCTMVHHLCAAILEAGGKEI